MVSTVKISNLGFGTMSMTWTPNPAPIEQSVEVLDYVRTKYGVKFFNGSTYYQNVPEKINLQLLREFCLKAQDPDLVISIKGGTELAGTGYRGDKENIDLDIDMIISYFKDLPVRPKIIYQLGRRDPKVPYEESVGYIYENVKNGKIDGISLSEVSAETFKKAVEVAPLSTLEIEFSLFTQDIIDNGILEEASKHGVSIVAYSPLCRGILTDFAAEHEDFLSSISESDLRKKMGLGKFLPENYQKNKVCLEALYNYAHSKGCSLESLALSYIRALSELEAFEGIKSLPRFISIPSGSTKEKIDKNFGKLVELSSEDIKNIQRILHENPVYGLRYNKFMQDHGMVNC